MNSKSDFKKYLDSKKCFKLICGAGNEDYEDIKKLCALYASAGCRFFDLNASVEAIRAAKEGIKFAGKNNECFICVSVGTKNDPHISKCRINPENCILCGECEAVCIQNAIHNNKNSYNITSNKCIGCGKCIEICQNNAIDRYSKYKTISDILPPLVEEGIDCIEFHTITDDEYEVMNGIKEITDIYKGPVSISINRSKIGNDILLERLHLIKSYINDLFLVQADGNPMSGGCDDYRTTLQAVAMADIIEKSGITPYVIVSGGTNSKTYELLNMCNINICGIAVGSYARKIVKKCTDNVNFWTDNNLFNSALKIAKSLIKY